MIGFLRSGYSIHIRNFDGPLDLLLELIKNYKLNITEISLSDITEQYLYYLRTMQFFNIDIASEFFLVAASLIYIKSKKLLPSEQSETDELLDEEELVRRLKEYKIFKSLARILWKKKEEGDIYFSRQSFITLPGIKKISEQKLYVGDLINSLRRYKGAFLKKPIPIKRKEVSVEEKMRLIVSLLQKKKFVLWSELALIEKTKIDRVATFLGGLELSFRQKVLLYQLKHFAEIEIRERGVLNA